jgi:DNA adenine methylase
MQNRFSPLRYPGGKGKMTDYMRLLFETNQLNDGHYVEPFAGGAAVALGLLFLENASHIHINDLDRSIFAFWHAVTVETEEFCKRISRKRVSLAEWHRQKEVQRNKHSASLLDLGYSTFFLNRTNRSGIINGGIIGGLDQTGEWKINARFNKRELISRIEKIASYSDRISIYNLDVCDLLAKIMPSLPAKSLIYLDPPYFEKGNRLYQSYYKKCDHGVLANWIQDNVKHNWLVSYDDVPEIEQAYKNRRKLHYEIGYSARNSYAGSEIMIFSDELVIPEIENPLKVAA